MERDSTPLTLHVTYEFLSASQLARLLVPIENIYRIAAVSLSSDLGEPFEALFLHGAQGTRPDQALQFVPPLALVSAKTGDSITLRFAPESQRLPKLRFRRGDVEVLMPRWTAAAVLAGAALSSASGQYNKFLEIQKNYLEVEKLKLELSELESDKDFDGRIRRDVSAFASVVAAPNITSVEVNGVPVAFAPGKRSRR